MWYLRALNWSLLARLSMLVLVVSATIHLAAGYAHAQVAGLSFDWNAIKPLLLNSLLPALWIPIAPVVTAFLTATINATAGKYVPRSMQVILIAIVGAAAAGLSGLGDPASMASTGAASQVVAQIPPATLLTDPPKS